MVSLPVVFEGTEKIRNDETVLRVIQQVNSSYQKDSESDKIPFEVGKKKYWAKVVKLKGQDSILIKKKYGPLAFFMDFIVDIFAPLP